MRGGSRHLRHTIKGTGLSSDEWDPFRSCAADSIHASARGSDCLYPADTPILRGATPWWKRPPQPEKPHSTRAQTQPMSDVPDRRLSWPPQCSGPRIHPRCSMGLPALCERHDSIRLLPVRKSIGIDTSDGLVRIKRQTSIPLIRGMPISRITTSGFRYRNRSMASMPL